MSRTIDNSLSQKTVFSVAEKLPRSLRVLHLGLLLDWPVLYWGLMVITRQLYCLSVLQLVAVDDFKTWLMDEACPFLRALRSIGMRLVLGDVLGIENHLAKGILGPRYGHSLRCDI